MTSDHSMQPTPEDFSLWLAQACNRYLAGRSGDILGHVASMAFSAGAEAELEACWEFLGNGPCGLSVTTGRDVSRALLKARRPGPPPLQQQALDTIATALAAGRLTPAEAAMIRAVIDQGS